ncbi:GH32 C-terminal domain-containing protein [Sporolactobacillus shoreicorticis]|uniref:GH32 C-terminal domain-containing protein n=1 Tax=Sporolactobacillus shoreicorticis TaxID=1923877 RepID=A0ABW5S392_9BACL|nr:GH32 C-terminal domain-containing protein [Sporolactobacillus shoreicorticis]MCO7124316.1 GH32 C-terminal domain-containing protein [Sporolactobacillus shoreicorticis]
MNLRKIMKAGTVLLLSLGMTFPAPFSHAQAAGSLYQEAYRDQYHYSAQQNWLNDPNGLIKYNGVYHMFYQHNPSGNEWGNMSWGHATSTDLIHWKEQEVAIPQSDDNAWVDFWMKTKDDAKPVHYIGRPTTNWDAGNPNGKRHIFSGSVILDKDNVAGFGKNTLIAYYTSTYQVAVRDDDYSKDSWGNYLGIREVQEQNMAYSTDGGKTFTKYNHQNPVIPATQVPTADAANFRDPKVVYDSENKQWVMPLVSGQEVDLFTSTNLKDWTYQSAIKREHDVGNGVWECPELIPMKVKGSNRTKWVLSLSVQLGAPAGGSGMQYFVGNFNGKKFIPETSETMKNPQWLDFGEDFYAGIIFGETPGRTIMLGWMSNWSYVGEQNTSPWHGEMTLPRELTLERSGNGYTINQSPVREVKRLGQSTERLGDRIITADAKKDTILPIRDFSGKQYRVSADFSWKEKQTPNRFGFRVRASEDGSKYIEVGYHPRSRTVYLDRTKDGEAITRQNTKVILDGRPNKIKLTVYVDSSSIEAFVNDGEKTLTQVVYPNPDHPSDTNKLSFFVNNGKVAVSKAVGSHLESIWGNNPTITGPDKKYADYGATFHPLEGITAVDPKDGDLTSKLEVSGGKIKTKKPGIHNVHYSVSNSAGVKAHHKMTVVVKSRGRK